MSFKIQAAWRTHVSYPHWKMPLENMTKPKTREKCNINRMIVAYRCPMNLGNLPSHHNLSTSLRDNPSPKRCVCVCVPFELPLLLPPKRLCCVCVCVSLFVTMHYLICQHGITSHALQTSHSMTSQKTQTPEKPSIITQSRFEIHPNLNPYKLLETNKAIIL